MEWSSQRPFHERFFADPLATAELRLLFGGACFARESPSVYFQPPKLGGQEREGGDQQASEDEERTRDIASRRDPRTPRCGDREYEESGDRATQQLSRPV